MDQLAHDKNGIRGARYNAVFPKETPWRSTKPRPPSPALWPTRSFDATPIQAAVLETEADGRDLLVSAQTGSGKTVAYGIAIAETLLEGADTMGPATTPRALIIAPTRELAHAGSARTELALSICRCASHCLRRRHGPRSRAPRACRRRAMLLWELPDGCAITWSVARSKCPISRPSCWTKPTRCSISASGRILTFILETTPAERRTLLFSATLPKAIVSLAQHYQRDALRIRDRRVRRSGHADIEYRAIRIAHNEAEQRRGQFAALSRSAERARFLQYARDRAPSGQRSCASAASPPWHSREN